MFLLSTSGPVTRQKHFLIQCQVTGSDHGFWQRDSYDVPGHQNRKGQYNNYRLMSHFQEEK